MPVSKKKYHHVIDACCRASTAAGKGRFCGGYWTSRCGRVSCAQHSWNHGEDSIRHLQEMVSDGILLRHEDRNVPPSVRYSISEYGMTLVPVLEAICEGGENIWFAWGWHEDD